MLGSTLFIRQSEVKLNDESRDPSRVGHLNIDGDYSNLLPATLDVNEHGEVALRIPYLLGRFPERWFWDDHSMHIGPNGKPIPREPPPTVLDYFDEIGSVGLIDCRASSRNTIRFGGMAASSGVGEIAASYAVEKAEKASNYTKINGLRSEIDGLAQWLNLWAHRTTRTYAQDNLSMTVSTTMELPPDLPINRRLNLSATVLGTAPRSQKPEVQYTSTAMIRTHVSTARTWEDHLALHRAIRDLLRVAVWRPISFRKFEVTSDRERVQITEDKDPCSRWCLTRTAFLVGSESTWDDNVRPLFWFADIGKAGVARWLKLYDTNTRGLRPFLRLLDLREGTIEEQMTLLGIAMEALGYQAFLDSGTSQKRASGKTIEQRVRKLTDSLTGCIPNIPHSYPKNFADSYNAVKHANRPQPNPLDLISNYRLGIKILRAWIALRLGVSEALIQQRLR